MNDNDNENDAFSPETAVMLLIDHQVGTMSWVSSIGLAEMKRNALALAKAAKAVDIPLLLTSSMEDDAQGPLLSEFQDIAPAEFAGRYRRHGVVDALDDAALSAAVQATGRKHLIIAGVTNDVCTVFPTLTALRRGFQVHVVVDAGGSPSKIADDAAIRRMEQAGAITGSTNQVLAELAGSWTSEVGGKIVPIVMSLVPQPQPQPQPQS
ncbi:isochorismatase family protein [Streptomyces buecherae]|uniref:isochorismatase family protein n=1 Tax=Streptomyces buecherae TaxID=2763006 RepID=UPI0033CF03C4